jgi:gliding motility-associated-like protein
MSFLRKNHLGITSALSLIQVSNSLRFTKVALGFLLILFSLSSLAAQSLSWSDSCSGMNVGRIITPRLVEDSVILICKGDTLKVQDTSADLLHNENISVRYRFNGGIYFNNDNFSKRFNNTGDSILEIQISNDSGCYITTRYRVKILEMESQISVNSNVQCINGNDFSCSLLHVNYGSRNLTISQNSWKIDGILDTFGNAWNYQFQKSDTFHVSVEVNTTLGCVSRDTIEIAVLPSAETEIIHTYDSIYCYQQGLNDTFVLAHNISFRGSSNTTLDTTYWSHLSDVSGDDTLSWVFDPNKDLYGNHVWYHTVKTDLGCTHTDTFTLYMAAPPVAKYSVSDSIVCEGSLILAYDESDLDIKDPWFSVRYFWNQKDSIIGKKDTLKYYPKSIGNQELLVFGETELGCRDTFFSKVARVSSQPEALFSSSKSYICEGDTTSLSFTQLTNGKGWNREWFFNNTKVSTDSVYKIVPANLGGSSNYGLKPLVLKVFTADGCLDSSRVMAGVVNKPAVIISRTNNDSCLRNNQRFKVQNKINSNRLTRAVWSFEDNTKIYDTVAVKAFVNTGANKIKVSATDIYGCADSAERIIQVSIPPKSRFGASSLFACENKQKFKFFDSSTTSVGSIVNSTWLFSDGVSYNNPSGGVISHTFSSAGDFKLNLVVENSLGCVDTFTEIIQISAKPTADFTINNTSQCLNVNKFEFSNNSTSNGAKGGLKYYWDFGDSTSSTLASPNKIYTKQKGYTATLTATNSLGCSDSTFQKLIVLGLPTAKIGWNTLEQCVDNQKFEFSDSSVNNSGSGSIIQREWIFGDNTTKTGSLVTKNYQNSGSYNLTFFVRLSTGCYDSIIKPILVSPKPKASFLINKDTQCFSGNNFIFDNKSSIITGGGSIRYLWSFADTIISNATHPSISFTSYGNFKAKLKVTSQYGCVDSLEMPLQVTATPQVSFSSVYPLSQCNSTDTFAFKNTTNPLNGRALKFAWTISDGSRYTKKDIGHTFSSPGNYQVVLSATNSLGCLDSVRSNIRIFPDPVADFKVNRTQQCYTSQNFSVSNQTTIGFNGGNLSYKWFLNKDSIGNSNNTTINRQQAGNYILKLIATSANGCVDSQSQNLVVLSSPKADFAVNDSAQCLMGNEFLFDNISLNSGLNPTFQWLFGDGLGAQTKNTKKSFTKYRTYQVSLITTTNQGCSDTMDKTVIVHSTPTVDFGINDTAQCLYGNTFKFNQNSKNSDNSNMNYSWEFEKNKTASGDSVSYRFNKSGVYFVKLTSKSSFGCFDSLFKLVRVHPQPNSLFSVDNLQQCLSENKFKFKNLTTISSGSALSYMWSFGDGSSYVGRDTSHSYNSADTFQVTLIAKSLQSCEDTFSSDILVNPQPVANFSTTDTGFCLRGNNVKFINTTTISNGTFSNDWFFGDGKTSMGIEPVNRYSTANRFNVRLRVTSNLGCEDSIIKAITIFPNPENGYRVNQSRQCLNQNKFVFLDTTKIKYGTTSVSWDFGNGKNSNSSSALVVYDTTGKFAITQISKSDKGCSDTFKSFIEVLANPKSNFIVNDSIQCEGENDFEFQNRATITTGKFFTTWNYGDGTVQIRDNGKYSYTSPGRYSVQQIATSDQGCNDTLFKTVIVTERVQLNYAINQSSQCEKYNRFTAKNTSTYNGKETINYFWDMGNGDTVLLTDLDYKYPLYGSYNVTLNAVTSEGCLSKSLTKINVFSQGVSNFSLEKDTFCLYNNEVRFKNSSRVDADRFAAFNWDFGDGNSRNLIENSPLDYSYNSSGQFRVQLVTLTQNLCRDTAESFVTIIPMPTANATVNANVKCFNEQDFKFEDISLNPTKNTQRSWIVDRKNVGNNSILDFSFPIPGDNEAILVIQDEFGCTDSMFLKVNVLPSPIADFLVNKTTQCLENNEYVFTNVSSGTNGKEGLWQPEPSSASWDFDLNYVYFKAGIFSAKLTVYNNEGCQDTIIRNVVVNPTPEGFLTFDNACVYTPVNFSSNSQIVSGSINTQNWVLGDGTFSEDFDPVHTYDIPGRLPVSVLIKSDKGCQLYLSDSIDIYKKPDVIIGTFTEVLNINQPQIDVFDESADGPFLNYQWDMGDGSPNIFDFQVIHVYEDTGWYKVSLMVESFDGCLDTGTRLFYVSPEHRLLFPTAFSPNNDGINDVYQVLGKFQSIKSAKIAIINENGNLVFETSDINRAWNGNFFNSGDQMSSGTYIVKVYLTDMYNKQFEYTQRINLIR